MSRDRRSAGRHNVGPRRTCIGCRAVRPPDGLLRVTRAPDGSLAIGSGEGRGAWLCQESPACFAVAVQRRAFARALRGDVASTAVTALGAVLQRKIANVRP